MSNLVKILIPLFVVIGMVLGTGAASYISAHNYANTAEQGIIAADKYRQNVLGSYHAKLTEIVQVPTMKADDLARVSKDAMSGRYGEGGSKAVMTWIKENYPGQVTDNLYERVAQVIEAGRNEFKNSQTRLIDEQRAYQTEIGYFWRGFWIRMAGYPHIDLNKYAIITTDDTKKAFETGVDNGKQLR